MIGNDNTTDIAVQKSLVWILSIFIRIWSTGT